MNNMKNLAHIVLFGLALSGLFSCVHKEQDPSQSVVAKVDNMILTRHELSKLLPPNMFAEDSVVFAQRLIEDWIRTQLLYKQARINIKDFDGSIERQIKQYTQDLYIHRYEQLFINQRLDTLIPTSKIDSYYESQKKDFILKQPAIKPLFIVFSKETDISRPRQWFYSRRAEDSDNLKDFTYQFSPHFYFNDTWFYLTDFMQLLPADNIDSQRILSGNQIILQDSLNYYFLKVDEIIPKGGSVPKELLYDEIAKILLHKRRQNLISNMRNKIFNDALNKQEFEIY